MPDFAPVSSPAAPEEGLVAELVAVIEAAFYERCEACYRPIATDEQWQTLKSGERPDLCWEPHYCGQDSPETRELIAARAVLTAGYVRESEGMDSSDRVVYDTWRGLAESLRTLGTDETLRLAQEMAWDQGFEAFAEQFTKPMDGAGQRPRATNPYAARKVGE